MTRKDYQLIADAIKDAAIQASMTEDQKNTLIEQFCGKLRRENDRFQPAIFINACQ